MSENTETRLCEVCNIRPMLGVASTSIPYSCAYCKECAERGADPLLVFQFWAADIAPDEHRGADDCVTFVDGRYVTYREWYNALSPEALATLQAAGNPEQLPE